MADENAVHRGSCYCGAVKVTVKGPPAASGYCHCLECRKWHSAPINALAMWANDNVTIEGPTTTSKVTDVTGRVSCSKCGGCVATLKPTMGMTAVFPMTLAGPEGTFKYEPAFHIFYAERVMDIGDGLPKFADVPEQFGGSGKTVEESARTGWH